MKRILTALLVLALCALPAAGIVLAQTAPPLPALGSDLFPITVHLSGQFTATKANAVRVPMPFDARVLYVTLWNQAVGGTHTANGLTSNFVLKNNATAVATMANIATTAQVVGTLTAAQQSVVKDAVLVGDLTIVGNSPTLDNITVTIWVQRR